MSKKEFIIANKGKMRPVDMAEKLKCSKAYVSMVLKPKVKVIIMDDYFDIDKEYKRHYL